MWGHLLPVGLVQVLGDVLCVGVVFRVISNGLGPVVCGPDHLGPGHGCAGAESTSASKQINYSHDSPQDRKSTRLNSSHVAISYADFCLTNKNTQQLPSPHTNT